MKSIVVLVLAINFMKLSIQQDAGGDYTHLNGQTADNGQFPYAVALVNDRMIYRSSGTLVTLSVALTDGVHVFQSDIHYIVAGATSVHASDVQKIKIAERALSPNDIKITLLLTQRPFRMTDQVWPVPIAMNSIRDGEEATAVWFNEDDTLVSSKYLVNRKACPKCKECFCQEAKQTMLFHGAGAVKVDNQSGLLRLYGVECDTAVLHDTDVFVEIDYYKQWILGYILEWVEPTTRRLKSKGTLHAILNRALLVYCLLILTLQHVFLKSVSDPYMYYYPGINQMPMYDV